MSVEYPLTIKQMPEEVRPRERLVKMGAGALSDVELLAILLRTGTQRTSALELAQQVLSRFGGIRELLEASLEELASVRGVGSAKAVVIKAALEIGYRLATAPAEQRVTIRTPEQAAQLLIPEMRHLDREHFLALVLNTKNQVLARERISVGTLNATNVHAREVFKSAIRRSAAALILAHNHPSGDPTPSQQDLDLTAQLVEAGEVIGIAILDHIIIGDNRYTSLKALGLI
ncbi:MAG: RadC family protein [Bacillota bacterium]